MKQNAARNALGLGFCLGILGVIILLSTDLPKHHIAAAVPVIFMSLAVLVGILKIILLLTDSAGLKRLDELSFVKMEMPDKIKHFSTKAEKPISVLFFIGSIFILLGMVYVVGFYLSSFVAGFVFTYLPTRNWKKSLIIGFFLALVSFTFSSILPGKLWEGIFYGS